MVYFLLRIASALIAVFAFAAVVVRAIPYDDSQLRAFMLDPENCAGECLLGIRPGVTTLGETMEHLQSHLWVESVQLSAPGTGYGQIRWLWSGQQPTLIDDSRAGRITFYWDREEPNSPALNDMPIQTISIYTEIRMAALQDWFGIPDSGTATIRPDGELGYSAAYHVRAQTIALSTTMRCPTNLMTFWNAPTRLSISVGQGTSRFVVPEEMVKLC